MVGDTVSPTHTHKNLFVKSHVLVLLPQNGFWFVASLPNDPTKFDCHSEQVKNVPLASVPNAAPVQ